MSDATTGTSAQDTVPDPSLSGSQYSTIDPDYYSERIRLGRTIIPQTRDAMLQAIETDRKSAREAYMSKPDVDARVKAWISNEEGREASHLTIRTVSKGTSGNQGRDMAAGFEGTAIGVMKKGILYTLNEQGKTEIDRYVEEGFPPSTFQLGVSTRQGDEVQSDIIAWGDIEIPSPENSAGKSLEDRLMDSFLSELQERVPLLGPKTTPAEFGVTFMRALINQGGRVPQGSATSLGHSSEGFSGRSSSPPTEGPDENTVPLTGAEMRQDQPREETADGRSTNGDAPLDPDGEVRE